MKAGRPTTAAEEAAEEERSDRYYAEKLLEFPGRLPTAREEAPSSWKYLADALRERPELMDNLEPSDRQYLPRDAQALYDQRHLSGALGKLRGMVRAIDEALQRRRRGGT